MIVCEGCQYQRQCSAKKLACHNYVTHGRRGSNPSRKWYLVMHGINVDYANRRIAAMAEQLPVLKIADWIKENVAHSIMGDITIPSTIKPELLRYIWRLIPVEQLELEDFVR